LAHELKRGKARAEASARTDFLTGLQNRRAFYEDGERLLRSLEISGRPAAVLMFDIDHFKSINDRYGHAGGDVAIRAIAQVIRAERRAGALGGAGGGGGLALLVPDGKLEGAVGIAGRGGDACEHLAVDFEGQKIAFTTSVGVAALHAGNTLDGWIAHADAALYRSKQEGRNRVTAGK